MQTLVVWLLALYGLTVCWVQLSRWLHYPQKLDAVHYYIYTYNSQSRIEWVIRYLSHLSRIEGRPIHFYIIDEGSEDDTLKIVEKLTKHSYHIQVVDTEPKPCSDSRHIVTINLQEGGYQCELTTI